MGGLLTGLTVIVMVATLDVVPMLSLIVYVFVAVPLKFDAGVYVTDPKLSTVQIPFEFVNVTCRPAVKGSRSSELASIPSASVSFEIILESVTGVFSRVTPASSLATGGVLPVAVVLDTVMVMMAELDRAPKSSFTT